MRMFRVSAVAAMLSLISGPLVAAPKPPSAKTHGTPKTTTHGSAKTTTTTHGNPHKAAAPSPTAATTTAPPLNPIAQKVSSNHGLQPKVNALLPTGMTLNQASLGFKNQGQFIAALHVSRNLGIPFADLKTAMTGIRPTTAGTTGGATPGTSTTTAQPTLSLGQAIQKLRPSANAETAAATADRQATIDLNATATATTTAPSKKNGK